MANKKYNGEFDKNHIIGLGSEAAKQAFEDIRKDPDNKGYYDMLGTVTITPTVLREDNAVVEDDCDNYEEYDEYLN